MEGADFLERVARRYGVDEEESLPCAHILLPHRATGKIDNVSGTGRFLVVGRTDTANVSG